MMSQTSALFIVLLISKNYEAFVFREQAFDKGCDSTLS